MPSALRKPPRSHPVAAAVGAVIGVEAAFGVGPARLGFRPAVPPASTMAVSRSAVRLYQTLCSAALLVSFGGTATAQIGSLDPGFGTGGIQVTDVGLIDDGFDVVVRDDGTILVAGYTEGSGLGTRNSVMFSFLEDGTFDETLVFSFSPFGCPNQPEEFRAITEDSDGSLLAGGWGVVECNGLVDLWVVRFRPGVSVVHFERPTFNGAFDMVQDLLVLPDGRVVAAGFAASVGGGAESWDLALAGYNADGTLDETGFALDGERVIDVAGDRDQLAGIAVDPDGRIVACGFATIAGQTDIVFLRLHPDGTLDTSFGTDGMVTMDFFGFDDKMRSLAVLADGSILGAGSRGAENGLDSELMVIKLDPDGALDPAFGDGGVAIVDLGGSAGANAMELQADGKIVVGGNVWVGGALDSAVARLTPNGYLDPLFGDHGTQVVGIVPDQDDAIRGMTIDPDGDIVVAGYTVEQVGPDDFRDVVVARFQGDGSNGLVFADGFETGDTDRW